MALKVWKEGLLELISQQLSVAVLEEIRRLMSASFGVRGCILDDAL